MCQIPANNSDINKDIEDEEACEKRSVKIVIEPGKGKQ